MTKNRLVAIFKRADRSCSRVRIALSMLERSSFSVARIRSRIKMAPPVVASTSYNIALHFYGSATICYVFRTTMLRTQERWSILSLKMGQPLSFYLTILAIFDSPIFSVAA